MNLPFQVERVLRRCLAKDPRQRLRDIGEARVRLEDPEAESGMFSGPVQAVTDSGPQVWPTCCRPPGVCCAVGPGGCLASQTRRAVDVPRLPTHLTLTLPDGLQVASRDKLPLGAPQPNVTISDDGRLVLVVVERDETTWLYRRFLDEPTGTLLEDSRGAYCPRISPNGEWISFMAGNTLMRLSARGDRPTKLVELPNSFGHDWINDDEIVVNRMEAKQLLRMDAERGTFTVYERETDYDEYFWPRRVPGTSSILINSDSHVAKSEETDVDQVSLMDLETGRRSSVGIGGTQPQLMPGGPLLLVRDGVLAAAPFDLADPSASVRTTTVLEQVLIEGWIGQYAVSQNGTAVYVPGEWLFGTELVWDDGQGNIESLGFDLMGYGDFELSPDGKCWLSPWVAAATSRYWVYDLERRGRRLLTTEGPGASAIWSPDGQRLIYSEARGDSTSLVIRTLGSNETREILTGRASWIAPYAWHQDAGIVYNFGQDIYLLDPDKEEEPRLLVATDATEWGADFSPDGRWIAYTSDESGRYEIYARAIEGNRSWTVSLEGGEEPIFSADGKTIFYRNGNRFYATPVLEASTDGKRFRAGQPEVVVEGAYSNVPGISYDVGPDGRLVLLRSDGGTERPGYLNVILNWDIEVARRMAEQR